MTRRLITATLAAALAFTPMTAAPARAADAEDVAKVAMGIATLAIIGAIVSDRDGGKSSGKQEVTTSGSTRYGDYERYDRYDDRDWDRGWDRGDGRWQKGYGRKYARALPAECLFRFETRRGPVRAFGERCLQRNMRHVNRLPDRCEQRIRTRRGWRDVYIARCLKRQGWTIEARNRRH